MSEQSIPFIDLAAQQAVIRPKIDAAIARVLDHGQYIMGPEVAELEKQLAEFCGATHAIACSNGTDALALGLMAKDVRPGDAIFCPSFTFAATGEVVAWLGATPYFVDILEDTYNMDPESLSQAILDAKAAGHRPVGIIPVDLFGQAADYDRIEPIAEENGLWMMCDTAQGFGATYKGRVTGSIGHIATTSFFPAKPLGGYGDGGAIFVGDDELAKIIRSLVNHGYGSERYDNVRIGMNGRLDSIQAAILIEKLALFPGEIEARDKVAKRYSEGLSDVVVTPVVMEGTRSVWAQYTIRAPGRDRSSILEALKAKGIPTAIYYPKPMHVQTAYQHYPKAGGALPVCDRLSAEVFSLPMHAYLDEATQDRIIDAVRSVVPTIVKSAAAR
ncbi:DegT/DnrJ/EryC1/StrS family aminotransferase [Rhizobium sp. EC-SD404]|uniref:DegT/DnrJ/EryC1/StrS family aminotransferase n=1 Tax=Rhizobium sp. EC-SD404 TaxID=2038389 RepID=UPI001255BA4E|nr:DegT/DnrJ/EryC1/StrS family aminotransferase [Rhizobium sp. EC-SD404]VVT15373.1 UDP-2-acetamido-2-deoxy-3-oxo-D-glucuronate aminotransferase [Rhizobium sp. EC-SD404]